MGISDHVLYYIKYTFGSGVTNERILEILISVFLYGALVFLVAFWRSIFMNFGIFRRLIEKEDRHAGYYTQIIDSSEGLRYSILYISYRKAKRGYGLRGFQYDGDGRRSVDFESDSVTFPDGIIDYVEFVWRAEAVLDKARYDGYTRMQFDDPDTSRHVEGRGFFITFEEKPRRFNLRFIKLTPERLRQFGIQRLPKHDRDRIDLIKKMNKYYTENRDEFQYGRDATPLI